MNYSKVASCLALTLIAQLAFAGHGSFRDMRPINTPYQQTANPGGKDFTPIAEDVLKRSLEHLLSMWNTPQMQDMLSEGFYDKDRLMNSMNTLVPRDARIRLLDAREIQILQQETRPASGPGDSDKRVSIISATLSTQLEFSSPTGFVQLPGVNRFVLEVTETLSPGGAQ